MNMPEAEENRREIIIVKRRRSDDEGGHHGGVWKIAFADFMTAMMCFFLVLWLVNATSDQTKAAIASYFNPMTLVETAPSSKGLDDASKKKSPTSSDQSYPVESDNENRGANHHERGGPGQFANSVSHDDTHKTSDQHLFADPYAVLAEIAAQTASLQNISEKGDGGRQISGPATGAHGGESYRDPFAPDFWSHEVATADEDAELDVFRNSEPEESSPETSPVVAEEQAVPPHDDPKEEIPAGVTDTPASQLAEQLRVEINDSFGRDSALNKAISISVEGDGVLISVTEELDFGMFEIGSAVPKGELVLAMEKIGAVLDKHSGSIRINGHTDGRPFSNENYDNWRLSTARAHSAYYMLVRTGIDETRIKEVAGFADRRLKITSDPLANVNRRIEIFLEPER